MILSAIQVIAFDCDGVLFDSSAANQAYYNHILAHFGLPVMTASQQIYVHMHTVHESLSFLFGDPRQAMAAEAYRREIEPLRFIRLMTIEPRLRVLLAALQGNYKTAIATNRVDTMNKLLIEHGLENCFDLIVTAADVSHPKPHPDMLLRVLEIFAIQAKEMVYIGDSSLDETAARQAGVPFIAYRNPALAADAHIDDLGQIIPLLGKG